MSSPVTRAELRSELARYPTRDELRETLRSELARYPTRDELRETLRSELASYPTRDELRETLRSELASYATKHDLEAWGHTLHAHLQASLFSSLSRKLESEIARFAKAIEESNRSLFVALDDKYKDLPGRVAALEDRDRQP